MSRAISRLDGAAALGQEARGGRGQLRVTITDADGLPERGVVSFSFAGVQRELPTGRLRDATLKFPEAAEACGQPLNVRVLQVLSTASVVLHPGKADYVLSLGEHAGEAMSLDLRVQGHGGPGVAQPALWARGAGPRGAAASAFLARHGLLQYIPELFRAVLRERPSAPYAFLQRQLEALLVGAAPREQPAEAPAAPGAAARGAPAELRVLCLRGLPEGALISIRAGGGRLRAEAPALLGRRLALPRGLSLRVAVHLPVATAGPRVGGAGRPRHHWLSLAGPEAGSSMSLGLHVREGAAGARPACPAPAGPGPDGASSARSRSLDGSCYLEQHGLVEVAQRLMRALVDEMPQDPYTFMVGWVAAEAKLAGPGQCWWQGGPLE